MAGEKILCVDDEDPIRKLCTVYLAKRGYRVEAVANGVEALKLIESKGAPDLVVTDVNMPLMNGLELVKRLREDRRKVHRFGLIREHLGEDARQVGRSSPGEPFVWFGDDRADLGHANKGPATPYQLCRFNS